MPHEQLTLSSFPRAIAHIDADAFFTSVEQAVRPELKGKPIVTGQERGIVSCASYEAKALGVRRPTRLSDALKICPKLICLPSDYETYSIFSKRLFQIVRRFTPSVEEYSIDEAFADLGGLRRVHHAGYAEIALQIKQTVQKELGITVSVGLSATRTLAKLASARQKPDGFTVVRANELHHFLPKVRLQEVCGFGPNTTALLMKQGVNNVWDYVKRPEEWAKQLLGKIGVELWHELRGECVYPVQEGEREDQASISKCKTFTPSSSNREFVRAQLVRNVESAFIKARRHKLRARGMAILLRDHEFRTTGVEAKLDRATSSTLEGARLAVSLFQKVFESGKRYRLTGVVLFHLEAEKGEVQYSLFDDVPKIQSLKALDRVIDEASGLYGKHALHMGASFAASKRNQHRTQRGEVPERRKELLRGETARRRIAVPLLRITV